MSLQVRSLENDLRHSPDLKVTEPSKTNIFHALTDVLSDSSLDGYREVVDARKSLEQVRYLHAFCALRRRTKNLPLAP